MSHATPLFISFYTKDTPYEQEVKTLEESLDRFNLDYSITGVASAGDWCRNCALKGPFVLEKMREAQRPIVWLDADAIVVQKPDLFAGLEQAFAIYGSARYFRSCTIYFDGTPAARELAERWAALCESHPDVWDQRLLVKAWHDMQPNAPSTYWLPETYAKKFDDTTPGEPVIVQNQASRRFKSLIK